MSADAAPKLSFVIPAFNKEEILQSVLDDHRRVLAQLGLSFGHATERVIGHHPWRGGVAKAGSWRIVSRAIWDFAMAMVAMPLER